ncbi:Putative 5-formyltetrahydrofolate cyclo-ligase [Rhizopus microsporus]|nr:Putative 5-formyltetrahydrofolate cyclo-ligase [Rhizopus microsporus]
MKTAIVSLKRQLRKDMASRLEKLSVAETQSQSEQVFERLKRLEQFKNAKNVSVYISMPTGEVITTNIIHHLLRSGKNCFIPRCTKTHMDMVKINSIEDFNSLPVNKWKIPEPPLDQDRENALETEGLDLVLMPGVAFDQNRNRIGHGKGYYDRYLRKCKSWAEANNTAPPKTIALALDQQIVDVGVIPLEETDEMLDCVLSPSFIFSN